MIDLTPFYDYVEHLQEYRRLFETLAEESRQAADFLTAKECLVEAVKMRSACMQLNEVIAEYNSTNGATKLPELPKMWS